MLATGTEVDPFCAMQQPEWPDRHKVQRVRAIIASRPPLVAAAEVYQLRFLLARVAAGEALVLQAGDCAEDPREHRAEQVRRKSAVLDLLAGALRQAGQKPVVRVGRIAGQFAKPRSNPVEQVNGFELPVFRGHMVNGPEPDLASRVPDPRRILTGYRAARRIMEQLGWRGRAARPGGSGTEPFVWTSHEALLLDYELPMVRKLAGDHQWLASTHWPWLGLRTGWPAGAHVALLAGIVNPVACKVGPDTSPRQLRVLCRRLDPQRVPGRLTLIARMGAQLVAHRLPALVAAVRSAGHPAIWLCDPMHGNTIRTPDGRKTRLLRTIEGEVRGFRAAVAAGGGVAGGLHLETTPDDVAECVADAAALASPPGRYTSHCDPRLTPSQAVSVVSAWAPAA
jgi:3-deoxy-7-phosphoheptulonate synthase